MNGTSNIFKILDAVDKNDIINYVVENYYNETREAIMEQASGN